MKAILLAVLTVVLVALSGCATKVRISGVPQVSVPHPAGGGVRGSFPPNNIVPVVNGEEGPVVLTVYETYRSPYTIRLDPGQQAELTARQLVRGQMAVVATIYDPTTGVMVGTATRTYQLTNNGGQPRVNRPWIIQVTGRRQIIR